MEIADGSIPCVKLLRPVRHADARGEFVEVYRSDLLRARGVDFEPVQENHIVTTRVGTIRGLHFQAPPFAQAKLVRVTRGAIFDVAVDLRHGSPTYGRHVSALLSAADWNQMYVPEGFAHGFCTVEPDTQVVYKVNRYRSAQSECGVLWNDPALQIRWPVDELTVCASDRDLHQVLLAQLPRYFEFH